ncbi:MAG: hypothetical protein JO086_00020 [Acidimicrobiia bacterium]|nr:hypothetical protein [Acidimicrobiia bacterium]
MRFHGSSMGDLDVPDMLADPVAAELRDPALQSQLYGVGRALVRSQLRLGATPATPSGHPGLDKILSSITDPLVAGVRDEATPWALGALAVAGFLGYALGRR